MVMRVIQGLWRWYKNLDRPLTIWWRCNQCHELVFDTLESRKNHVGHEKYRWAKLKWNERILIRLGFYKNLYE